jgi:hypothetical protein
VARDAKKGHVNDPCDECDDGCEAREQAHDNCARAVVGSAEKAKEESKSCKACGYGMENEGYREVMDRLGVNGSGADL